MTLAIESGGLGHASSSRMRWTSSGQACAEVARRARSRHGPWRLRSLSYAASLPFGGEARAGSGSGAAAGRAGRRGSARADREARALYWLGLDAINFGSGWFPTLQKRDGMSGYRHDRRRLARASTTREGPLTAGQLSRDRAGRRSPRSAARTPRHELIELYALLAARPRRAPLQDAVHRRPRDDARSTAAGGSAVALATRARRLGRASRTARPTRSSPFPSSSVPRSRPRISSAPAWCGGATAPG